MTILASKETRILVQGITGREAASFTLESINYGAKIVAGVTPGRSGSAVHGIPVFDSVAEAVQEHPCDATIISVPPAYGLDAASEALDNGIRLLVILTERLARRDVVQILERAKQEGARVIGPNSLGLICPDQTRIGMCGGAAKSVRKAYIPGPVGILSRSGGMMTELANLLTVAGIGQSTCISIGGDPIIGSTFVDLLPLYEEDPETRALVLFSEPGGMLEEELAERLKAQPSRLKLVAFVAGRFMDKMQGMRFGHAGAIVEGRRGNPYQKIDTLRDAGVQVAARLSDIPVYVKQALDGGD